MSSPFTVPDAATCSSCRAPLPDVRFAPTVVCGFCQATQPNPRCLIEGQEVLFDTGAGFVLARVRSATGPDSVEFEAAGQPSTKRLDELIPVVRPDGVTPTQEVFVRDGDSWRLAQVVEVTGSTVRVNHPRHESSFFDRQVDLLSVRVRATAQARSLPGWKQALFHLRRMSPARLVFIIGAAVFLLPPVVWVLRFLWLIARG